MLWAKQHLLQKLRDSIGRRGGATPGNPPGRDAALMTMAPTGHAKVIDRVKNDSATGRLHQRLLVGQ